MALTKVSGSILKDPLNLGEVSIGGTLTYQDVTNVDALGIGTFRAGIDITGGNLTIPDKIIHSGDTNTSLRFPSADTITAETGGDERLRITSGGLVGVGQASPTHMLHVDSSNASDTTATAFFKGRIIRFDGAASAHSPRLNFSLDGTDKAQILLHRTNIGLDIATLAAEPIKFKTNSTEALRITSDGKIGIGGESSPEFKVTVYDAGYSGVTIKTNRNTATDNIGGLHFKTRTTNVAYIQSLVDGTIKFRNSSSLDERVRIESAGNVIIAETMAVNRPRIVLSAPNDGTNYRHLFGANLQVNSSGTFTTPTANISGGGWEYLAANSLNAHGDLRYISAPDTNATSSTPVERLRITSGGHISQGGGAEPSSTNGAIGLKHGIKSSANNVIIGETTQAGAGYGLQIESRQTGRSGSARIAQIGMKNDSSGNGQISFFTSPSGADVSERMVIKSNGVVAISTTTDSDAKSLNVYTPGSGDGKYAMQIENGYGSQSGGNVLKMKTGRGDGSIDIDVVRLDLYNNTRIFSIDNSGLMRFRSGCGSGSQDALAVYGVRAWINFSSINNSIRGKGGLSGISDRGTGQFTYNFSTSMPDGNYTVTCNSGNSGSGTSNRNRMSAYDLTTASFKIDDYDSGVGIGPSLTDRQMVHVMVVR